MQLSTCITLLLLLGQQATQRPQQLETTTESLKPPEVLIVYSRTNSTSGCTEYCYVNAISDAADYTVISQPHCQMDPNCQVCTNCFDWTPPYPKTNGRGHISFSVENNIRSVLTMGSRRSVFAYDWVANVDFFHNETHVFAKEGTPERQQTVQLDTRDYSNSSSKRSISEIHVSPLRAELKLLVDSPGKAEILTLTYRRNLSNGFIETNRISSSNLNQCGGVWSKISYSVTLNMGRKNSYGNVPTVVLMYKYGTGEGEILSDYSNCSPLLRCDPTVMSNLFGSCSDIPSSNIRYFNLQVDAEFAYFSCHAKRNNGSVSPPLEWIRVNFHTCNVLRTQLINRDLNGMGYSESNIESGRIYQILPNSPYNYPMIPETEPNLSLSDSYTGYAVNIVLGWSGTSKLRPAIQLSCKFNPGRYSEWSPIIERRVWFYSFSHVWYLPREYQDETYNVSCTADWSQFDYPQSSNIPACADRKCISKSIQITAVACLGPGGSANFGADSETTQTLALTAVAVLLGFLLSFVLRELFAYCARNARDRDRSQAFPNLLRISSKSLTSSGEVLGRGRFGNVERGVYTGPTGQTQMVAIKCLHSNRCGDADRRRFQEEVLLLADLHSPYVLKSIGVCLDSAQVKFVTELITGGTLLQLLKNESNVNLLEMEEVSNALYDVARGLQYIHDKGIIHNDISARNCLVVLKVKNRQQMIERVKIADFGLAKGVEQRYYGDASAASTETYLHTTRPFPLHTSAPEVHMSRIWSRESDIWQFGCLIWQTLHYGAVPFLRQCRSGDYDLQQAICERRETPQMPRGCPLALRQLAERCFQFQPAMRPTALDMVQELKQWRRELRAAPATIWTLEADEFESQDFLPTAISPVADSSEEQSLRDNEDFLAAFQQVHVPMVLSYPESGNSGVFVTQNSGTICAPEEDQMSLSDSSTTC